MSRYGEISFENSIRDYDYTKRARVDMTGIADSGKFADMPSDTIFHYLMKEMQLISFGDYLRRYLYERSGITEDFRDVSDDVYLDMILQSFSENAAPHSLTPNTRRWNSVARSFLTQDCVKRSTIFLLGFGLRMSEEDVEDFLTKVIKETGFDMADPTEVIYRYCFRHQLPYARALALEEAYRTMEEAPVLRRKQDSAGREEDKLLQQLWKLKNDPETDNYRAKAYTSFLKLLDQTREQIAGIYRYDSTVSGSKRKWDKREISYGDIERMICSGIPINGSGNLSPMSASLLNSFLKQKRMSRQRIDNLVQQKYPVNRFDLITLVFFLYSQRDGFATDQLRCTAFIEEADRILTECGMMGLYAANPYEAFVMLCLLTEAPLATYSEVWEISYTRGETS